jgi:hypothetical protein
MKSPGALFLFWLIPVVIGVCLAGDLYGGERPKLPTTDAPLPDAKPFAFECPRTKHIDCMPPVQEGRRILCSPEYLEWVRSHCPDVEVVY